MYRWKSPLLLCLLICADPRYGNFKFWDIEFRVLWRQVFLCFDIQPRNHLLNKCLSQFNKCIEKYPYKDLKHRALCRNPPA